MNLLELRQALHAVLGFRSDIPTATPDQIIAAVRDAITRADDAEQELAKVHAAHGAAGVPAKRPEPVVGAGLAIGAVDRVRLLAAVASLNERKEASNLATPCQDDYRIEVLAAHAALDAAGTLRHGTPEERIRRLVAERDDARENCRRLVAGRDLTARQRDEYRDAACTLRAELDAYRSRGVPPAEAPKPAPDGVTLSAREVRALALLYKSDRDGDPRPAKQAIGVLLGVSDA